MSAQPPPSHLREWCFAARAAPTGVSGIDTAMLAPAKLKSNQSVKVHWDQTDLGEHE
jgi:hypothetical protein